MDPGKKDPAKEKRPAEPLKLLKFARKYWPLVLLGPLFMVLEVSVDLYQPRMMELIVDRGILGLGNAGRSDIHLVTSTGIRMILLVIAGRCFGILSGVCANIAGQSFGNNVRKACFDRIMHFSFEQTDAFSTGSLITRITNDVTQIQQLFMQAIRGFVRCMMFFIGGTAALLSLDISFGQVLLIAFPLIFLDIIFIFVKTNPLFSLLQKKLDDLNNIIGENVSGIRVVKAFVQEKREEARFENANKALVGTQFRVELLLSFMRPVMNIVLNLSVVAILFVGSLRVRDGSAAPGTIMAAVTYITLILNGMMSLAMIFQTLSRGIVSASRLTEILDTEPAITGGSYIGNTDPDAAPAIRFEHVDFSYPGSRVRVLSDISFEVRPGETVAIIGATGSGKTTLVNLIPRFYDPTYGRILLDGVDIKDYDLHALRENVTVCLQKSELFQTTIRENIALGNPDASEEEIISAAIAAQANAFIREQPEGYDTPVAEGGMSLSGGQRQRIAISRALLKRSGLLIFDDSTSALDLATEARLYDALRTDYKNVTKIMIAQRIASVIDADRILVLDNGRVSAFDTHANLMKTSRLYQDIYASQLKDADTEAGKGGVV
ncbi:MAG: ABC transporter ATP-binding protein [Lachnospiraceae bacterium]|nr:ABC transporter ATP-binding protein [Lachnospiraceae bacterium]